MEIIKDGSITTPIGFYGAGDNIGIKKIKKDLAIIYSDCDAVVAGTFTTNVVKAAPVTYDQHIVDNYETVRAIAINSGVANACTGNLGEQNNLEFAKIVAKKLSIKQTEVLICSTGVIGKQLPMECFDTGVKKVVDQLKNTSDAGIDVANAILTTDTSSKHIAVKIDIGGKDVLIGGCTKGSGMIHPNMATMLGFITSDINISQDMLKKALKDTVDTSFNMISVDRDTSTNDTVLMMASKKANNPIIDCEGHEYNKFVDALCYVNTFLAKKIAEDGEGATKLLEVQVHNADNIEDARKIAKSVVTSPLVKTAVYGNDANWGRILCAMGYSSVLFDPNKVKLTIESEHGSIDIVENGMALEYSEEVATKILSGKYVKAIINIYSGNKSATAWGCDLSYDYIKINADYRS